MVLSMVNGGGGSVAAGGAEGTDGSAKRSGGDLDEVVGAESSTAIGGEDEPDAVALPTVALPT
jgi:hypothetical protein